MHAFLVKENITLNKITQMEYYIFKEACNTRETGSVYPQIQRWNPRYNEDAPNSYYAYNKATQYGGFTNFEPNLYSLVLNNKANPTDLIISFISNGFIISEKLKATFDKFSIPSHRYYTAKNPIQKRTIKRVLLHAYYIRHYRFH